jgi:hypothetical protein
MCKAPFKIAWIPLVLCVSKIDVDVNLLLYNTDELLNKVEAE